MERMCESLVVKERETDICWLEHAHIVGLACNLKELDV